MTAAAELVKVVANFGAAGLVVWFMYRLVDKWAALFLQAQQAQTKTMADQAAAMGTQGSAMQKLAETVAAGQSDQKEVLIAVRLLADRIDTQKGYLEAIEKDCRERGAACK